MIRIDKASAAKLDTVNITITEFGGGNNANAKVFNVHQTDLIGLMIDHTCYMSTFDHQGNIQDRLTENERREQNRKENRERIYLTIWTFDIAYLWMCMSNDVLGNAARI